MHSAIPLEYLIVWGRCQGRAPDESSCQATIPIGYLVAECVGIGFGVAIALLTVPAS
jgi:hypothetical protein